MMRTFITRRKFQTPCTHLLAGFLLCSMAGCANPNATPSESKADKQSDNTSLTHAGDPSASASEKSPGAKSKQPAAKKAKTAQTKKRTKVFNPRMAPVPGQPNVMRILPPDAPEDTSTGDEEAKRQQAEDLIYATIRVRMEEMIIKRRDLLKAGKKPYDVEVRRLEGSIMRARNLLLENGEEVEDVDPPIVQSGKRP